MFRHVRAFRYAAYFDVTFTDCFNAISPNSRRFSNFSSFHLFRDYLLHPLGFNGDEMINRQGITSSPSRARGAGDTRSVSQTSGGGYPGIGYSPPLGAFPGLSNVADILSVTRQGRKRRGIPKGASPLAHCFAAQSVVCYTFCPGWRGEGDAMREAAPFMRQENGRGYRSGSGHSRAHFREGTEGIPLAPVLRPAVATGVRQRFGQDSIIIMISVKR